MNDMAKNLLLWIVIAVVLLAVFQSFNPHGASQRNISYSDFMQQVENNAVAQVSISATMPANISGKRKDGSALSTTAPIDDSQMIPTLRSHGVEVTQEPSDNSALWRVLLDWIPFIIFIGLLFYFMRQMQAGAGGRGAMSFGARAPSCRRGPGQGQFQRRRRLRRGERRSRRDWSTSCAIRASSRSSAGGFRAAC
jgi:cell division protease FtsH